MPNVIFDFFLSISLTLVKFILTIPAFLSYAKRKQEAEVLCGRIVEADRPGRGPRPCGAPRNPECCPLYSGIRVNVCIDICKALGAQERVSRQRHFPQTAFPANTCLAGRLAVCHIQTSGNERLSPRGVFCSHN